MQKRAERKYKSDVSNKNPWNEPTSSTKNPAPTVPRMAANVPAVFDIPKTRKMKIVILIKGKFEDQRALSHISFIGERK